MEGRTQGKATVRERIIDGGMALFAADGFEATTTQRIAAAAGVTQRTLFRYFARKDQIVGAAWDDVAEIEAALDRSIMVIDGPADAVAAGFMASIGYYDRTRDVMARVMAVVEQSPQLQWMRLERHMRLLWLIGLALDGRAAYLAKAGMPTLRSRIRAGALVGTLHPLIEGWRQGELNGALSRRIERAIIAQRNLHIAVDTYCAALLDPEV